MSRNGAYTLSDQRTPYVSIVCRPCNRRGRYAVARLMDRFGDIELPRLLGCLVDCARQREYEWNACQAVFDRDVDGRPFQRRDG